MAYAERTSGFAVHVITVGDRVLLLAYAGQPTLHGLPRELGGDAPRVLDVLHLYPSALAEVRRFLHRRPIYPTRGALSDAQLVATLRRSIQSGEVVARVIQRAAVHRSVETFAATSQAKSSLAALAASRRSTTPRPSPAAPTPVHTPLAGRPAPIGSPKPVSSPTPTPDPSLLVANWPLDERVEEVARRAAPRLPNVLRAQLLGFLTPENIALMAAGVAVAAAANLTPAGWIADGVLAGIGFAYVGLAVFSGLRDVCVFVDRTYNARSETDLNAAAEALAAAIATFGILGLIAILHRSAGERPETGAAEPELEERNILHRIDNES